MNSEKNRISHNKPSHDRSAKCEPLLRTLFISLTGAAMCNMFVCIVVIRVQCNKQIKFYFLCVCMYV